MDELKNLLGIAWALGKYFYKEPITTIEQYNSFTEYGNGLLKAYKPNTKQWRFVRALVSAVDCYAMEEWEEKNNP